MKPNCAERLLGPDSPEDEEEWGHGGGQGWTRQPDLSGCSTAGSARHPPPRCVSVLWALCTHFHSLRSAGLRGARHPGKLGAAGREPTRLLFRILVRSGPRGPMLSYQEQPDPPLPGNLAVLGPLKKRARAML